MPAVKSKARRSVSDSGFYIKSNRKFKKTILSCGGQFKSTFSVAQGDILYISPAFGDLGRPEDYEAYVSSVERFLKENRTKPQVVAFDLHPEYASTRYAQSLDVAEKVGVQHHHAHLASLFVDAQPREGIIGVAFDGTGFGLDGAIWGGEFFSGWLDSLERKARLKYIPMPGGEMAVRQPWRMAASWLYQIYGDDFLGLGIEFVRRIDRDKWRVLKKMIDRGINSPPTSSMGRLFDAVSSLVGLRDEVEYEAQAAIELEGAIDDSIRDSYEFGIDSEGGLFIVDPTPLFASLVEDLKKGAHAGVISARFHNAISDAINSVCVRLRDFGSAKKVALSGGVFLNRHLSERVRLQLASGGFELAGGRGISVGDSGISAGQALIAGSR